MKEIVKAATENKQIQKLCKLYVESISKILEVKQMFLFQANDILTIIEAPAFDFSIRKHIYEAEQIILERILDPSIEFRLINLSELQDDLSRIVDASTLYKK